MAETNRAPDGTPAASEEAGSPDSERADPAVPGDGPGAAVPARPRDGQEDAVAPVTTDDASAAGAPAQDRGEAETSTLAVPTAPAQQPLLEPAADDHPAAPKKRGNRLVGTAWVLLAAGLFEVLYFAVLALIVLLLGGPAAVGPQLAIIARSPFAWLPVVFFLLLFELTVLLFNRTGRFAYVVASLVVGFLVYTISVLLISILVGGGIGDTATLARAFESPEFVLTGLVAREVMLWTGFAIGARGKRVRTRNRAARDAYRQEIAERTDAVD